MRSLRLSPSISLRLDRERAKVRPATRMEHDANITSYLFEHARDIILVIEAVSGSIIDANRAAETAYQYTRDELLALRIYDLRIEASSSVTDQSSPS